MVLEVYLMTVNHLSTASWNPDIINNEPKLYLGKSCIWGKASLPLCLSEVVSQNTKSKAVPFLSLPTSAAVCLQVCSHRSCFAFLEPHSDLWHRGFSANQVKLAMRHSSQVITCVHLPLLPQMQSSDIDGCEHASVPPLPGGTSPNRICLSFPTHSQRTGQYSPNLPSCLHDHSLVISTQDRLAQMSSLNFFGYSEPACFDQNKPGNNCSWESWYEREEFCKRCGKFLYVTSTPLINAQGLVQIMQLPDALLPVSFTRLHNHETSCVPDLITSISLFKYFCMPWS